jgi:mRNA interferase RelE/StbE
VRYRVLLTPAAARELGRLRGDAWVALRGVILRLGDEPRPAASTKLSGTTSLWRLRVRVDGRPWRVIYTLDDDRQTVVIRRVVPRDEGTYRRLG